MSESELAPGVGFNEGVSALIRQVECREALLEIEKENIYRLRYAGYLRAGVLAPGTPEIFKDRFDETENGKTYGFYIENKLSASIRVHIASPSSPNSPAMSVFADYLQPLLEMGKIIVDPTRYVIDANAARRFPRLPYATVRIGWMACEHYGADFVLATIRTEHQAFYKRLFGSMSVSEARSYPGIVTPIILLLLDYRQARDRVHSRYPFFASTESERRAIFGSTPGFPAGAPADRAAVKPEENGGTHARKLDPRPRTAACQGAR